MKVTALIPDDLVQKVATQARGKTLTDSLVIALKEWIALKAIVKLNQTIERKPLRFKNGFSAESVRALNRRS